MADSTTATATPAPQSEGRRPHKRPKTEAASPDPDLPQYVKDEHLICAWEKSSGAFLPRFAPEDLGEALTRTYGHSFPLDLVRDMGHEMFFFNLTRITRTPSWLKWMYEKWVDFSDSEDLDELTDVGEGTTDGEDEGEGTTDGKDEGEEEDKDNPAISQGDRILLQSLNLDMVLCLAEADLLRRRFSAKKMAKLAVFTSCSKFIRSSSPKDPDVIETLLMLIPSPVYKKLCDKDILDYSRINYMAAHRAFMSREKGDEPEPGAVDWSTIRKNLRAA